MRTLDLEISAPTQAIAEERGAKLATEYFGDTTWCLDRSDARPLIRYMSGEVSLYEVHLRYYA